MITCPPSPPPITSPTGQPVPYVYGTPTVAGGSSPVTMTCSKENGSLFPIGSTTVTCNASDALQRADACSFTVTVVSPPRIQLTKYLAFGDSITYGEDGHFVFAPQAVGQPRPTFQFPPSQTYPGVLFQLLTARYTAQSFTVFNDGKQGESPSDPDAVSRFSSHIAGGAYEAALLMEGSNDINSLDPSRIPLAISGLRSMILAARARSVRVYLATVPPEVAGLEKAANPAGIAPFNSMVRSLASSENVPLVDVEAGFGSNYVPYIGYDGLHPNEAGYAKIADLFLERLRQTLEVTPTTTSSSAAPTTRAAPQSASPYSPARRRR